MAETQLMKQYYEIRSRYPDAVLFFRLGDFYEMFDSDAVEASSILNLTLTHRGDSPMCGIPFHSCTSYIKRLLNAGKKIAICEQTKMPEKSGQLAKREVVRVITPSTVFEDDFLSESDYNYVLAIYKSYCAFADISAGVFRMRELDKADLSQSIRSVITELSPSEILVNDDEYYNVEGKNLLKELLSSCTTMVTKLPSWYFNSEVNYRYLCDNSGVKTLKPYGISENSGVLAPGGALLRYVSDVCGTDMKFINEYVLENNSDYVSMDESTVKNLELFHNIYDGSSKNSLLEIINRCKTGSGTRLLKSYLSLPLRDPERIKRRQAKIGFFITHPEELGRIRNLLKEAYDLNRLLSRVSTKRAVPHDLILIEHSIVTFFEVIGEFNDFYSGLFSSALKDFEALSAVSELAAEISKAVDEAFLGQFNPGHVILEAYDEELDRLRRLAKNGAGILEAYLDEEKSKTGIANLKVGSNNVVGYYIEVSKGNLSRVPDYYIRKQTLTTGERFITERLSAISEEVESAASLAFSREKELYDLLIEKVGSFTEILNKIGEFFSLLDVIQSFATLALDSNYVCPEIDEDSNIIIKDGRHPVVEHVLGPGKFIANSLDMDVRFSLITGPNMAGKSTYLRQNAIIILLSHVGSYVPASYAKIGVVDRIFCRVGAMDNLARGESTFLLEMQETAFILRNSTNRSFVIVDEIGRGTGTADGISIAYAVMKALLDRNCMTLFATHFHELTSCELKNVRMLTLEVAEKNGELVFLRKVKKGSAGSSYALHAARLAGIPASVLREARKFQSTHFNDYSLIQPNLFSVSNVADDVYGKTDEVCNYNIKKFLSDIHELNVNEMTPVNALNKLSDFSVRAGEILSDIE